MKNFQYYLKSTEEIGYVQESNYTIVYANGLPNASIHEIAVFEGGETGLILSLTQDQVEILVFSKRTVKVGTRVTRTGSKQQMPVGLELLGQTIDPFAAPLDPLKPFIKPVTTRIIDTSPSSISNRKRIEKPFETGVTMVDLLIPLGKGQRELVIGDRKTGKTSFLHQTILNQARNGTLCIYTAIGKNKMDIKKTENFFKDMGITKNICIIASSSEDPSGVIYLTPYCAMTLAEYFRDQGHDVLVVFDDLFTHAKFYREISLIGRRFPGRNSYPADIFYTHARLIERAGNFLTEDGSEHSITCLPVVESVQGDIAGFIQTNLMSMTDGHIYFDVEILTKGHRPAINPFLSVSRVGGQTQSPLRLSLHRELISFLSLNQRLENFSHFGAEAGPSIKKTLAVGERIMSFFTQGSSEVMDIDLQIIIFGLIWQGVWDEVSSMINDIKKIQSSYRDNEKAHELVKDIISQSDTLNNLLLTINKKRADISVIFGMHSLNQPITRSNPAPAPANATTTQQQQANSVPTKR